MVVAGWRRSVAVVRGGGLVVVVPWGSRGGGPVVVVPWWWSVVVGPWWWSVAGVRAGGCVGGRGGGLVVVVLWWWSRGGGLVVVVSWWWSRGGGPWFGIFFSGMIGSFEFRFIEEILWDHRKPTS